MAATRPKPSLDAADAALAFPRMEPQIACSVLIPVLNEERYIEASVEAMRRQAFDGELEFLFVDGGSTDRTREILERLALQDPRIRVLDNPVGTVSSGLNVALRHARGRWALRMDAHTVYPDDYAHLGVQRLDQGGTRWVSGPQVPTGHGAVSRAVALALASSIGRGGSRKWGEPGTQSGAEFELDTGIFAGVWERDTLLEYGGWDERWPRNSDSEMAARFLARGERLICLPAMAAEYVPRDSLRGLWRQYLGYGEFRARTSKRHPHSMRASQLLAPAAVITTGAAVLLPRRLRRLRRAARLGQVLYGATLIRSGARARDASESASDAALVPVVLLVMHFAHGLGQMNGWRRYGPPWSALAHVLRLGGLISQPDPDQDPVFAPSLHGGAPVTAGAESGEV
jgi:succinoglycan biosynthesis protein ExoA